jgi:hypothetical protein
MPHCCCSAYLAVVAENAGLSGAAGPAGIGQMARIGAGFIDRRLTARMTTMALPPWMLTSVDAVALAIRLRRTDRHDLIDAVERGDMSLEAAVEQAEREQALRRAAP